MRRALPVLILAIALALPVAVRAATTHVVQPGETLHRIALRYGVSVEALMRENGITDPSALRVGQVLRIPAPSGRPVLVRAGPASYHVALAALSRGTGFLVLARQGAWVQVQLPDGRVGWVAASEVEPPPAPDPPPPPIARLSEARVRAITQAWRYLGVPYRWGGSAADGLDCSGLIVVAYRNLVPGLPRVSYDQFRFAQPVAPEHVLPGDLVFFSTDGPGASHVGIYLGELRFLHASSAAGRVVVSSLTAPFYRQAYLGARRVLP